MEGLELVRHELDIYVRELLKQDVSTLARTPDLYILANLLGRTLAELKKVT